ncbi:MAG: NACHT domain-containing protein [Caldilineaceae bacterium]
MTNPTRTILILAANPINTKRLRLDAEQRAIDDGLRRAPKRDQFQLIIRQAVRPADVRRELLQHEPEIIHFCGHGEGSAGIYLEDEQGLATLVTGEALSELFGIIGSISCVVLNACYSESQATAIAQHVPYVVGMSDQVSDDAALSFAEAFYDAIGAGRSYPDAFGLGRNAISLANLPETQTPIFLAKENADLLEETLVISFVQEDHAWVEGFLIDALETVGLQPQRQRITPPIDNQSEVVPNSFSKTAQLLLILSPSYPLNDVLIQLKRRFDNESEQWPVYLLQIKATTIPADGAKLPLLDGTDSANWSGMVDKLIHDLTRQPVPAAAQLICPYPGMRAYDEVNSHHFYGRDGEIDFLRSHLRLNPFIAVIGPSGSGKSSLVLAGLLPALREKSSLFGPGNWIIKTMRPGTEPLVTLKQTLHGLVDEERWQPIEAKGTTAPDRILLVVDQFEEIFTFADASQSQPFQKALLSLIAAPRCYVVITVRADFYVDLMSSLLWEEIAQRRLEVLPLKEDGLRQAIVKPAANSGVYIEEALVNQLLDDANNEPGVLPFVQETMVLLWEKLERRYLPAAAYTELSDGTQQGLSGLYLAMTQRASSTLNSFNAEQRKIARRILLRLIQFGEGRADTRRQQPISNLLTNQTEQALFTETLNKLTNERLLTLTAAEIRSAETGERKVDIAHEALLNGWPQLRTWINERRAAEQIRRRLEEKATDWVRLERSEGGLMAPVALAEAEFWLASADAQELGASQDLIDLVHQSRRAIDETLQKERRARLLRLGLVGAIALLLIGLLAGAVWVQREDARQQQEIAEQQRQAAEEANLLRQAAEDAQARAEQNAEDARQAQDLAEERLQDAERQSNINRAQTIRVQSQLMLNRNAECSLALALEAYDIASDITNHSTNFTIYPFQDSVRTALQSTHTEQVLPAQNALHAIAWSHDGRTIAAGMQLSGGTQLWERAGTEFKETINVPSPGWVGSLAFSPDDEMLAIGGSNIVLVDRAQGTTIGTLSGHSRAALMLAWHPSGRWLASSSSDGTVIVWDVQMRQAIQTLGVHQDSTGTISVMGLAWNQDGSLLASAGFDNNIRLWNTSGLTDDTPDESALTLAATWWVNDQGQPVRLAWSPDGQRLAASYSGGTIQIWNTDSATELVDDQAPLQTLAAHTGAVWGLTWDPTGTYLASSAEDQSVRIWTGNPLSLRTTLSGHTDSVAGGVAWNSTGTAVASASTDRSVRVWKLSPGGVMSLQTDGYLLDADWHPDPKQLLVALTSTLENTDLISLWDIGQNSVRTILATHRSTILRIAWSPDGTKLATASADTTVHLYDAQTGERMRQLTGNSGVVIDVAWSPDGRQVASAAYDYNVFLWIGKTTPSNNLPVVT